MSDKVISLPYMRVTQKNVSFYLSKASALDLRRIVDFHFREPYKEYASYQYKGFDVVKRDLEDVGATIDENPAGWGVQRVLNRNRVLDIRDYIERDPEALFPATVLLAIDTSRHARSSIEPAAELEDFGTFEVAPDMGVSVIDGQHRLAGLFLASEATLRSIEMPLVFMLDVSVPVAAKLFQHINGKQQKVNKSVIFDLFDNVPEESLDNEDDRATKLYHTVCVSLYTDPDSPLYRQIKMLGVGGGAISQAFFIDICKKELKCFRGVGEQLIYDELFDYFSVLQQAFPEDWPKPLGEHSDEEIDAYSAKVLRERKSQLAKTNGMAAVLRLYNWLAVNKISTYAVKALNGEIDWTEPIGTGGAAQTRLFKRLKQVIIDKMALDRRDHYVFVEIPQSDE